MKSIIRQLSLFGIIVLAAIMVFSLASCGPEPDGGDKGKDKDKDKDKYELPSKLVNTTCVHDKSGDKVHFPDKETVEITISGQANKNTYTLKYVQEITELNEYQLRFKDKDSAEDVITYNGANDQVKSVMFSIIANVANRSNTWVKDDGSLITEIHSFGVHYTSKDAYNGYSHDNIPVGNLMSYEGTGGNVIIPSKHKITYDFPNGKEGFYELFPDFDLNKEVEIWCMIRYSLVNKNITSITFPNTIKRMNQDILNNNPLMIIKIGGEVIFDKENYPQDNYSISEDFDKLYINLGRKAGTYKMDGGTWKWDSY